MPEEAVAAVGSAGPPEVSRPAPGARETELSRSLGSTTRARIDGAVALLLVGTLAFLLVLSPRLLAARLLPGVDTAPVVRGIPVGWHGIYFFTGLAVAAGFLVALRRSASFGESLVLTVAGLGAFEALYGTAFALTTGRAGLLVPPSALPTTGWAGIGTWVLVEALVALFALVCWDRLGYDRYVGASAALLVTGLALWDLWLGWGYPPYDNRLPVYCVNTLAEVSGSVLLPLLFTSRRRSAPGFLGRLFRGVVGRLERRQPGRAPSTN